MAISKERQLILDRIADYEKRGLFDRDVNDDPPTRPLRPGEVDYTCKKLSTRIAKRIANKVGQNHFEKMMKNGDVVLKEIKGRENLSAIESTGALITCNHFSVFDNYAVYKAVAPILGKRDLYKIIREGNYTSFPGLYGYLFRHCNTLPLSSSLSCMKELLAALHVLFSRGEKILIYPEQGMWHNYRKPRPLKLGSFRFAAKENVPVLPIFITLEDTDRHDADGMPIQAYTVHILPAIFPDKALSLRENSMRMCLENYKLWKATYEAFYGIQLEYTTEGEVNPCSST
ncbi:MAG: 1-acyl-sn-glycerol-3-phosphate acyltransferase [Clostridia bacterium]|nr:1-acyl-sn-glycerol-3-phosphate acyltransferase [Clostridia bacterium]